MAADARRPQDWSGGRGDGRRWAVGGDLREKFEERFEGLKRQGHEI